MMSNRGTVVSAFTNSEEARAAVMELRDEGFAIEQVGVAGPHIREVEVIDDSDSYAAEGAVAGMTAGAGLGALWGLGIVAGVMPILGPAIAGGTLAAILTSAVAGAAGAGLAGALIGMGVPKEEAIYYESELSSGRTIVTVTAPGQEAVAEEIMRRHGGYTRETATEMVTH
jgi:hypothetical protein